MPFSFEDTVAQDYQIVDGTQTVLYTTADGRTATLTDADAHEYTQDDRAVLSGAFAAGDRSWYLPGDQLAQAGITPEAGGKVTDAAGKDWLVTGACALDDLGISWSVPTTKKR